MAALLVVLGAAAAATDVLMIAVDDLRPQLACTDVPGTVRPTMHTPHICGFANDSLVLLRSQVHRVGALSGTDERVGAEVGDLVRHRALQPHVRERESQPLRVGARHGARQDAGGAAARRLGRERP